MADIQVNGRTYRLVAFDEYTLNEAMVFWDYTKMSQAEINEIEGFNPAVIAAMIHIAVARGEPGETERSIRAAVGAIPVAKLNDVFMEVSVEAPDDVPLPDATSNGSGDGSSTSSAQPPAPSTPPATGSRGSATGATYGRRTWAT
jgi:hypothetical protein